MEAAVEREVSINACNRHDFGDSDEENDSDCPIFGRFYEAGGIDAIHKMTNFDPQDFDYIWGLFSNFVLMNYNVGRGRKSDESTKDCFS